MAVSDGGWPQGALSVTTRHEGEALLQAEKIAFEVHKGKMRQEQTNGKRKENFENPSDALQEMVSVQQRDRKMSDETNMRTKTSEW